MDVDNVLFSEGTVGRFKYWNRNEQRPIRALYRAIRGGNILGPEEAEDILGVTYNPEWTYVQDEEETLIVALTEANNPRYDYYSPCMFPLPLPDQQINKPCLHQYRDAWGKDMEFAHIGEAFACGTIISEKEALELMHEEEFRTECFDPYYILHPGGEGIFIADGPLRPRESKRDFDPRHYFAPYQIKAYIALGK